MIRSILMDWGGTLMQSFDYPGPMVEWPQVALVPGVDRALHDLQGPYELAVATNAGDSGTALVRAALELVDIDRYFDRIFSSCDLGVTKPDPMFFVRILDALGRAPSQVVMVGDNYTADMGGAKDAGLWTVWYCAQEQPSPPDPSNYCDRIITNMAELPAAIHDLNERLPRG